ncbi:MAG: alpha-amylase, partial [Treponema sp.]|nr:alpha-amylase [Treponema sp.]
MKGEKKLNLILGSHAHVPSGASESEFEDVYENKMRPFVSNLYRYSNIQAVLHYSGVLLYRVERTHPEFFMLIEDMVSRKQAEILGGGFYEPMLPLIPLQDRIGQIELLTTYLRKHFGKRPQGCWIPGMAWEQHLAAALAASDMSFTFLSQDQFVQAGLAGEDLFYPCICEDQGKLVTVFPVSVSIETALAEKGFSRVISEDGFPHDGGIISIFPKNTASSPDEAPDSAWNRFFEELSLSENLVETVLPGKILKNIKPRKKASFPNSSCIENNFSPRRFLIEHSEAGGIYSKMIFTNVLISQLKGDKSRKQSAREELMKAQDSVLFTPGAGSCQNELRKAAYSSLLCAERLSREKGKFVSSLIQYDFDLDGVPEYLFQDARINCYIQRKGAGIFELDYLPKDWNYLDCGASGITRRCAFADALLPPETPVTGAADGFPEGARLCFNEQFEAVSQDRKGKSCFRLPASEAEAPFANIEIEKCYSLKKDILTVTYVLKNAGSKQEKYCFVPEIDFSFAGEGEEFVRFFTGEPGGKDVPAANLTNNTESLKILDVKNEVQIVLGSTKPFSLGLSTALNGGFYQANRILPHFTISQESGNVWNCEFTLKFS